MLPGLGIWTEILQVHSTALTMATILAPNLQSCGTFVEFVLILHE